MKKLKLLLLISFFLNAGIHAQITKGNWLVGGSGYFFSSSSSFRTPDNYQESKKFDLNLYPNIGYFLTDRFAIGLSPYFSWGKGEVNTGGIGSNIKKYGIGPFVRYYILETEKPFNILASISYQYGRLDFPAERGTLNNFSMVAGPVIYFNSSVGLEFTLGYAFSTEDVKNFYKTTQKGFQTGIGFQIYLEKE